MKTPISRTIFENPLQKLAKVDFVFRGKDTRNKNEIPTGSVNDICIRLTFKMAWNR